MLYAYVYVYQSGFYDVYGLSPEDVGVNRDAVLVRLLVGTAAVLLLLFVAVSATVFTGAVGESRPAGTRLLLGAIYCASGGLILATFATLPHSQASTGWKVVFGVSLVVWVLGLFGIFAYLARNGQPTPSGSRAATGRRWRSVGWIRAIMRVGRFEDWASARGWFAVYAWLFTITVAMLYTFSFGWVADQGEGDGRAAIGAARNVDPIAVSEFAFLSDVAVRPVSVAWTGGRRGPLSHQNAADPGQLLGVNNGTIYLYDLATCQTLVLPQASTVVSFDVGHPHGKRHRGIQPKVDCVFPD